MSDETQVQVPEAPLSIIGLKGYNPGWRALRAQLEDELKGLRRPFIVETISYQMMEIQFPSYNSEARDQAREMAVTLLGLVDANVNCDEEYQKHNSLRRTLLNLIALKLLVVDRSDICSPSDLIVRNPNTLGLLWRFLATEDNWPYNDKRFSRHRESLIRYVRWAYRESVEMSKRLSADMHEELVVALQDARADMLKALVIADSIMEVFEREDTSEEMIRALEDFAMTGKLDMSGGQRNPEKSRDVLSFGYSSQEDERKAALIVMGLRAIREDRLAYAERLRRQADSMGR